MSREKQIEELIDIITDVDKNGYAYNEEGYEIAGYANSTRIAEALYNAGYRKQKEGEWLDTGDEQLDKIYSGYKCSVCGFIICGHSGKYCSECGAKMKGGEGE